MYLCAYIVGAALVYHELIDHFYQNLSVLSSKVLQICWYFAEKHPDNLPEVQIRWEIDKSYVSQNKIISSNSPVLG